MSGWHTKGHIRPHIWVTGPDPVRHAMYRGWQVHKSQSKFRGEEFKLSFEEYEDLWKNDWDNRGRTPSSICMTRIDSRGAWEIKNIELITREEHFKRQSIQRIGMKYKPRYSKLKVQDV